MGGYERATEMNAQRLMSAFLLAGLLAAPALAFEVKPGEWTQEVSLNGQARGKAKICISPEQAQKYFQLSSLAETQSPNCKTTSRQNEGVVSFEAKCESHGGKVKVEGKGTARNISANEIQIESTATSQVSPQAQPTTVLNWTAVIKQTWKKISDTEVVRNATTTRSGEYSPGTDQATVRYTAVRLNAPCRASDPALARLAG